MSGVLEGSFPKCPDPSLNAAAKPTSASIAIRARSYVR